MKVRAHINDPSEYYSGDSPSLLWEMTICQSLEEGDSTAQGALVEPESYGVKLARYLEERVALEGQWSLLELGGGYGTLMEGLLKSLAPTQVTMVDLCPAFVERQRQRLMDHSNVRVVQGDMLQYLDEMGVRGDRVELAIANENIGDLVTVDALDAAKLRELAVSGGPFDDTPEGRAARIVAQYRLDIPASGPVALNLGALELVEKLAGRARSAFISEHSCDVKMVEPYDFLENLADGQPRRIELKDHAEYSIRFDHLEKVARAVGFETERIPMVELLGVRYDEGARFVSRAECVGFEAAEALHEFINHVKEYECLLLTGG